jgi:hypothetical protein
MVKNYNSNNPSMENLQKHDFDIEKMKWNVMLLWFFHVRFNMEWQRQAQGYVKDKMILRITLLPCTIKKVHFPIIEHHSWVPSD